MFFPVMAPAKPQIGLQRLRMSSWCLPGSPGCAALLARFRPEHHSHERRGPAQSKREGTLLERSSSPIWAAARSVFSSSMPAAPLTHSGTVGEQAIVVNSHTGLIGVPDETEEGITSPTW